MSSDQLYIFAAPDAEWLSVECWFGTNGPEIIEAPYAVGREAEYCEALKDLNPGCVVDIVDDPEEIRMILAGDTHRWTYPA